MISPLIRNRTAHTQIAIAVPEKEFLYIKELVGFVFYGSSEKLPAGKNLSSVLRCLREFCRMATKASYPAYKSA
ncbi:hypothetical protein HMPREF0208_04283 [Citrobacter koseri]|nr:hypothetical protein HMPREF3207_04195 [Citrobacter koseri]KXB40411.1 hypothetical protein HMPREF0208_04283 [Citrobacter koseri]